MRRDVNGVSYSDNPSRMRMSLLEDVDEVEADMSVAGGKSIVRNPGGGGGLVWQACSSFDEESPYVQEK